MDRKRETERERERYLREEEEEKIQRRHRSKCFANLSPLRCDGACEKLSRARGEKELSRSDKHRPAPTDLGPLGGGGGVGERGCVCVGVS